MKPPATVPTQNLNEEPYNSVVCYPKSTSISVQERILELEQLGVEALEFSGKSSAFSVPVLGKGYVGIVVIAQVRGERFALKMRREDADRVDLRHEAEMIKKANAAGVGPKFVAVSNNFLLSQLIDGDLLTDWLEKHKEKQLVHRVLVGILEQCWRLEQIGLDHGELSKAPKHLLVSSSDEPFIVDFETASITRKVANVTSVCQYLFAGNSPLPKLIGEVLGERSRLEIIGALKKYKKNMSRAGFETLLKVCLS
jgi:putative serine/threonine protein kinase